MSNQALSEIYKKNHEKIHLCGIKFAVFNVVCIFAQVTGITLLSAVCIAIVLGFIATTVFFRVRTFVKGEEKEEVLQGELIEHHKLKKYYESLYIELNNLIQTCRKAALLTDPAFTGKILGILFVTSHVAWHLGDFNFGWLAGNGYIVFPVIRIFFGPQIGAVIKQVEAMVQGAINKQKKD